MLPLLLHSLTFIYVFTVTARVAAAVTTETVVGMAGRRVTLPCRLESVKQKGVEVCWGRGEPSLFSCHNAVINAAGEHISYRRSYRYSASSSSSSLHIFNSRSSDSGFYHCRVQLPGLFNDQTSTVHLIIINPPSLVSDSSSEESTELSDHQDTVNLNAPHATASSVVSGHSTRDVTEETGSDAIATGPMVALVQSPVQRQQQANSLHTFIGNTLRLSCIVFIPALLLTAAYRVWRFRQRSDRRPNPSEEESSSWV